MERRPAPGTPWDLVLALTYTGVVSLVILTLGQGGLWAIFLVVFVPGYVLVAAVFPGRGYSTRFRRALADGEELSEIARRVGVDRAAYGAAVGRATTSAREHRVREATAILVEANDRLRSSLDVRLKRIPARERRGIELPPPRTAARGSAGVDWVERIALSVGLSIALASILALLLNLTVLGIRLEPIVVVLLLFTFLVGLVAYARRIVLPVEDRLTTTIRLPSWQGYSGGEMALSVLLGISVVVAAAMAVYIVVGPRNVERYTQLFILNQIGTTSPELYPTYLNVSEPGRVIIVVVNNESARVSYALRVDLVGLAPDGTTVRNRTTLSSYAFALDDRQEWRQNYTFQIDAPGLWRLDFILFRDGDFSTAYRNVFMNVTVVASA